MALPASVRTFELPSRFDEPIAVHAVETETHTVLFGGGDESTVDRYKEVVQTVAPDVIIVEHGDPDHYGALPALERGPDSPSIAVPGGDADQLREAGIEPDALLEAGSVYWGIETIGVPGHTPDNMAYEYDDVLIAGDTVVGADSSFAAAGEWSGPLALITEGYNYDNEQARQSVAVLLDHPTNVVLVTHGPNVEADGQLAIETLVDDLGL